ncbi:MAG: hypothetical protein ABSG88_12555 [Bradyrhizobium sp.]
MNVKMFLPAVVFAMILVVLPVKTFAQDVQAATAQPKAPYSLKLAQNSDCDQARNNANSCRSSWTNIGGGTSGQAGAFYQCWKTYCTLLQAHACNTPSYCSQ